MTERWSSRRSRIWRAGVTVTLLSAVASCVHGKLPARELYRLRVPAGATVPPALDHDGHGAEPALPLGDVAIVPYIAPGVYGSPSIVYRVGETEYGAYPNREWAVPTAVMLGMITEELARARPIASGAIVFGPPSPHTSTYIWRGLIRELEEVDRGRQVFAAVRLDARLVRARDDSVLWTGSVGLERRVPEGTMPAIVDALSRLSADAINQLLDEARAALVRSAASAEAARPQGTPSRR